MEIGTETVNSVGPTLVIGSMYVWNLSVTLIPAVTLFSFASAFFAFFSTSSFSMLSLVEVELSSVFWSSDSVVDSFSSSLD